MRNIVSHKGVLAQSAIKAFISLLFVLTLGLNIGCSKSEQTQSRVETPELICTLSKEKLDGGADLLKASFEITEGWHIYGPNVQKNGRPTKVEFLVGDTLIPASVWPATKIFDEGLSGVSEGFDGKIEVSTKIEEKNPSIKAKVSWVACKSICVPGEAELSL